MHLAVRFLRRRVAPVTMWALALLLIGVGCARPATTPPLPTDPPTPTLLQSADLVLPLDRYLATTAEVAEIASGYRALLRRCMARYAFAFPPADPPPPPGPRTRNERRYGLSDTAAAATRGYRFTDQPSDDTARPGTADNPALPPEATAVLYGQAAPSVSDKPVPTGGCVGEAHRNLSTNVPPGADTDLPQRLSGDSFAQSRRDPRVQAATRQWAACMKTNGYSYSTPFDPPADPRFSDALTPEEIAAAIADVACKQQINLVGIWFTIESAHQRTLIDQNATALNLAAKAINAQLAAARAANSPCCSGASAQGRR